MVVYGRNAEHFLDFLLFESLHETYFLINLDLCVDVVHLLCLVEFGLKLLYTVGVEGLMALARLVMEAYKVTYLVVNLLLDYLLDGEGVAELRDVDVLVFLVLYDRPALGFGISVFTFITQGLM